MLRAKGNDAMADRLASIGRDWRVSIVHQEDPKGLDAVGCASSVVDGDDLSCRSLMRSWVYCNSSRG